MGPETRVCASALETGFSCLRLLSSSALSVVRGAAGPLGSVRAVRLRGGSARLTSPEPLSAERGLEDHERVTQVQHTLASESKFLFRKNYAKYEFFKNPTVSLPSLAWGLEVLRSCSLSWGFKGADHKITVQEAGGGRRRPGSELLFNEAVPARNSSLTLS